MMDPYAPASQAGNPFAQPQQQQSQQNPYGNGINVHSQGGSGNPFGAVPDQQQYGYQQQNPFQQPQSSHQQHQQPPYQQQQQAGAADPWQQQQYQPQQQLQSEQQSFQSGGQQGQPGERASDPFSQPSQQQQTIVSFQQSANPYAIVQHPQQNNQWGVPQPPASPASFDPFAAPSIPSPAPPQQQHQAIVPVAPGASAPYPGAPPPFQQQQLPYQELPQQQYQHSPQQEREQQPPQEDRHSSPTRSRSPVVERSMVPAPSSGYPGSPSSREAPDQESETPKGVEARNKYSATLAQEAPIGASPLPRADMVRKTGYVLSRISFRTIVMKKWKQSFWVQYGPHTMLWFRSQSDFDDWLNNPYHTQAQRNFLIKLAVNFAHDLYKPNVRGYQVTQCRTKAYGTKMIRQFKLERWMDYGPTIAAAFGSNNPKEVDDLREALVGCMRNTPLNGGIRATGAVRERTEEGYGSYGSPQAERGNRRGDDDAASYGGRENAARGLSRSVASATDMMNDTNSVGAFPSSASAPAPAPDVDLLDFSEPVQQQLPPQQFPGSPPPGQPYPQQQIGQQYPQQQSPQIPQNQYPGQQQYVPPQQQYHGSPQMQQAYPGSPPPGQNYVQQPYPGQAQPQQAYGF